VWPIHVPQLCEPLYITLHSGGGGEAGQTWIIYMCIMWKFYPFTFLPFYPFAFLSFILLRFYCFILLALTLLRFYASIVFPFYVFTHLLIYAFTLLLFYAFIVLCFYPFTLLPRAVVSRKHRMQRHPGSHHSSTVLQNRNAELEWCYPSPCGWRKLCNEIALVWQKPGSWRFFADPTSSQRMINLLTI